MRFEKESDFVEIVDALSVDHKGSEVWVIESSIDLNALPIEFRTQVQKSDEEGTARLRKAVLSWATRSGYKLLSNSSD